MIKKTYYHTQERRSKELKVPILCIKDNAWFGKAYYFWEEESDAYFWGQKFKYRTGQYEVYEAEIESDNILDTVFNREHYDFWRKQIEKVAKKTNQKPTLKELNDYFVDKGIWQHFDGILFQDISNNPVHFMVKEFQYKKRIQLALYNKDKITQFESYHIGDCW